MLEWTEKFSTGVDEIDAQHKVLFKFVNELEAHMNGGSAQEVLARALAVMEKYSKEHFGFEELCMESYHCPQAEENKNAHRQFVRKIEEFHGKADSGEMYLKNLRDLHDYCEEWLTAHILAVDTHLKDRNM